MDVEARFEYDALDEAADGSPQRLAATAHALIQRGQSSRAIRLAQKLVDGGQRDARDLPSPLSVVRPRRVGARRQDQRARSGARRRADSPGVGLQSARRLCCRRARLDAGASRGWRRGRRGRSRIPCGIPALLFDPDANLQLGTAHLASFIKQHGAMPRVLAAYNAGGSRVTRWSTKAGDARSRTVRRADPVCGDEGLRAARSAKRGSVSRTVRLEIGVVAHDP